MDENKLSKSFEFRLQYFLFMPLEPLRKKIFVVRIFPGACKLKLGFPIPNSFSENAGTFFASPYSRGGATGGHKGARAPPPQNQIWGGKNGLVPPPPKKKTF